MEPLLIKTGRVTPVRSSFGEDMIPPELYEIWEESGGRVPGGGE